MVDFGGLILMPLLLGMPAFAPLMMEMMRPVAMGSLMGHLLYGLILGGGFAMLSHGLPGATRLPRARESRSRYGSGPTLLTPGTELPKCDETPRPLL
jgi:hypothetical protein